SGAETWQPSPPRAWNEDVQRFFEALRTLDARLAAGGAAAVSAERVVQGPAARALAHVGEGAVLRRRGRAPGGGGRYFEGGSAAGRVTAEQSAPRREFD